MKVVLVHYGEIALKGHNRKDFEEALARNIRLSLGKPVVRQVRRLEGRIVVFLSKDDRKTRDFVKGKLSKVFGLSWFAFAEVCKNDLNKIKPVALKIAKSRIERKTFKVETTRAYKKFPYNSMQTNEILGDVLIKKYKAKVSLDNPEFTVFVEIVKDFTFVYTDKFKGLGGLPVGSSGRVLVLLSGGIDSAVASYLMMKRGCNVDYLHIHALRDNESVKDTKLYHIFNLLKEYDPNSKLYVVPYHEFDTRTQRIPPKYNLILFRRFMLRLAENLANGIGSKAIALGDNLSQVASQTIESITVSDESVQSLIFRPLLSYDKEDIINLAKKIGTYELSIKPYKDCCSIVSRHPTTKPKLDKTKYYEKKIKIVSIVKKCSKLVEII